MDQNYQILQNKTLEIINSCFNTTESSACLHSLLLMDMTRKATLWMNFFLIFFGLLSNILVIIVFSRLELRKQSISVHTIALAVSDIFLLSGPVTLKWLNEYEPDFWFFRTIFWCKTHGYFDIVFCSWSAWNVVALSNERWMTICGPGLVGLQHARKRSLTIVILIPILSLVVFIWFPFVIETNSTEPDKISLNTFMEHRDCQPKNNFVLLFFGSIGICLTYLIPFLMILFYNSKIIKKLNSRIEKRKQFFNDRVLLSGSKSGHRSRLKKLFSIVRLSAEKYEMTERPMVKDYVIQMPTAMINVTITSVDESEMASNVTTKMMCENLDEVKMEARAEQLRARERESEAMRTRERIIRDQRLRNDRSINTMLITVSITFLVLTFPYQIVWIADQINKVVINYQLKKNFDQDQLETFFIKKVWLYQLVFYTIKDISLTVRNLNFSINFFLYSTMSNLFRKELNFLFQKIGFKNFSLFRNSVSFADKGDITSPFQIIRIYCFTLYLYCELMYQDDTSFLSPKLICVLCSKIHRISTFLSLLKKTENHKNQKTEVHLSHVDGIHASSDAYADMIFFSPLKFS
ncbi:alpha-2B adrenergic receptor-like [Brachionus plicatilis]|uniref:Alpha-2B adrenergic receptor-like n=1 Tax=Brachionus plicatilis TaxID=10195 RepID=A0A3M7QZ66_BRAPC|nr:alpha-2B adrenergic receptor-like [Brachionus plicatilis]